MQVKLKEVNIARAPATNKGSLCYDSQRHGNGQINKNNSVIVLPDTLDLLFFNLKEKIIKHKRNFSFKNKVSNLDLGFFSVFCFLKYSLTYGSNVFSHQSIEIAVNMYVNDSFVIKSK